MIDALTAAVDQAPGAICVLRGPSFIVEVANPVVLRTWGRATAAEVIGRPLFEAVPEVGGQGFEAILSRVMVTGEPFVGRALRLVTNGELRFIDRTYSRLADGQRVLVTGADVTEVVHLRQAHEADLERIRGLGLNTFEAELATGTLSSEAAALAELRLPAGTNLAGVIAAVAVEDRPRFAEILGRVGRLDGEVRLVDGRWIALRGYSDGHRMFALVGDTTSRRLDETERERLAQDVVRAEQRMLTQFMQAPVAVSVVSGPRYVYEHANPLYLEMVGRTAIVGRSMYDVFPELPANAPVFQMLETVIRTGQAFRADEFAVPIDRGRGPETSYFKFSCKPIVGADGNLDSIMTVAVDVSDHVRARQQLALADQRKDEFLAMLAHELRNPMAAVSTALALLDQVDDPVRAAKYREVGKRQMANLTRLVDDLLDVSRITRGKIELRSDELDLGAVVQQALATTRPTFEARGHAVSVSTGPGPFRIHGDATRLEQIVVNLLTNAAKYTEPGGRIEVALARENGDAVLRVRDSGRGIPADMLDKVWDLFVQVAPSIDRRTGGLGLGLTLVKRLAEMHGGTVEVRSEGAGKGSEFVVRLPVLERPAQGTPQHLTAVEMPVPQARRILVVEDSDDVRETLSAYLRSLGHEVFLAADGLEGVQRMGEVKPDVAFVDIGLPQLDGYEVARQSRAGGVQSFLVALTGYGGEEARAAAKAAGFDLHLTKPVELAMLSRVLDRLGRP